MKDRAKSSAAAPARSQSGKRKLPTTKAVHRSVASSTAIETGQSIKTVERKLHSGKLNPRGIRLAD